eukprot:TRINITY_DN4789_c0_g1_i3.p1 TRINITY_DN4789_c0_g1~~TRINITY_DN4789_c0_g1_i3.p1  ORF type:complete len:321 (-),score=93.34 TRINITY_DN4789_c0_g1_i3:130-1092(-)
MIRRPPRSTHCISSAASDVYKRQVSTQSTWGNILIINYQKYQKKFIYLYIYFQKLISFFLKISMHTLDDLKKKEKEDKKKNQHFTGNQYSGQMIEHPEPPKHKDPTVQNILQQAQDNALQKMKNNVEKGEEQEVQKDSAEQCIITIYENGFKIDNGEFRDYAQPQNKVFLEELKQGYIPKELRNKYKKGLSIALEDKSQEKYEQPPPPKYVAFSGQGQTLGQSPIIKEEEQKVNIAQGKKIQVDSSQPKTFVQIRYHNGQQQTLEINLSDKVQTIYNFIKDVNYKGNFQLIAGFPPKPLNLQLTIEEAELMDSTVTQKLC